MDMSRLTALFSVAVLSVALVSALAVSAAADERAPSFPQSKKPVDRGYGQHDACFGDKYESEDDLKTGNEQAVMETLRQLLGPGS